MARAEPEVQDRFSTGEVARLVQASRNTIVRYIEDGRIRAQRSAGGWYIIPRQEVIEFLWDLSFSKTTPPQMWRAASVAYEQMTRAPAGAGKDGPKEGGGKRKIRASRSKNQG